MNALRTSYSAFKGSLGVVGRSFSTSGPPLADKAKKPVPKSRLDGLEKQPAKKIPLSEHAVKWGANNPGLAVLITSGAVLVAAPALVSSSVLGIIGFVPSVQSGTLAAIIHSMIGNIASTSVFATLQSAGAGGVGAAAINGVVQATGGTMIAGGGILSWFKTKRRA